jgi:regulator of RNase E activity RraA
MAMLSAEQLEELKKFDSPTVCNAIERFKVRGRTEGFLSPRIRQIIPYETPLAGYASTGKFSTSKQAEKPLSMEGYYRHVQSTPRPSIAVLEDVDPEPVGALWGEVNCNIHKCLGSVGTVTNGGVRDLKESKALGYQYYASCVAVSHAYIHLEDFGCPVNLFGVAVNPGDLLFCDNQGIVIIPPEVAPELADACHKIMAAELPVLQPCRQALLEGGEIDVSELLQWTAAMRELRVK